MENIDIDIDIDKDNLKNIDIDMAILENIDIDIDKGILQNIDIDEISYRLGFGISNTPSAVTILYDVTLPDDTAWGIVRYWRNREGGQP